jgi:hypothetical protein
MLEKMGREDAKLLERVFSYFAKKNKDGKAGRDALINKKIADRETRFYIHILPNPRREE